MVSPYVDALATARPLADDEIVTHEGGVAYVPDIWTRLVRWLTLGSESGTFYVAAEPLTAQQVDVVCACLAEDGERTVRTIVEISTAGRAPKNDPALLALVLAMRDPNLATRRLAAAHLPDVARTGTHLLHAARYAIATGGWNRLLRRAFGDWFTRRPLADLAYQAVKYQSRDGVALADVLRLAHPKATGAHDTVLKWIVDRTTAGKPAAPAVLDARDRLHAEPTVERAVAAIRDHRLPREAIPTGLLKSRAVWDALLADMPLTAMIRNLGKMSNVDLLVDGSAAAATVVTALTDAERLRRARVHPVALLAALKVYEQGAGERGKLRWRPVKAVVTALDEAFYLAFGTVSPSNQRIRLAVDVSGSMTLAAINGMPFLTPRDAAAALALVTLNVEPHAEVVGFSDRIVPLRLRPTMRLDEVLRIIDGTPYGWTFCSLPITDAIRSRQSLDAFVSLTDAETADGRDLTGYPMLHDGRLAHYDAGGRIVGYSSPPRHTPAEALRAYRARFGLPTRHVVVALAANDLSLADPNDPLALDVAGFDAATPQIVGDFVAGNL